MPKRTRPINPDAVTADAMPSLWPNQIERLTSQSGDLLPDRQSVTSIRDSLYDAIPLGQLELDLINTAPFLRLQQIKQLGFVYRIWPGATHTRYEHSLGVYALMLRAINLLTHRERDALRWNADEKHVPHMAVIAALLHDIGHYPFSHAIEELGFPIIAHEQIGRQLITSGEIADVLTRHGIEPEIVASLIDTPRGYQHTGSLRAITRLLSGALDVDKLDYLPRDARGCNVPYGGVDVARLLAALRVTNGPDGQPQLAVGAKGISPLNSLVHARQEMFDNIYWHHTGRSMIVMLLRAVQEALLREVITPTDLVGHDDASLMSCLSRDSMPPATHDLVKRLQSRRHHRVVVEMSSRAGKLYQLVNALYWDATKRRRAEIALATDLSEAAGYTIPDWALLIDIPKPEKWEMDVTVCFDDPPLGMQQIMSWVEATGQTSDDLQRYEIHQRRVRVVAAAEVRDVAYQHRELLLARLERLAVV
jgi:uncharacterized protein